MEMEYTTSAEGQSWEVQVPVDRADVVREVDLIEECMRMHGFNRLGDHSKISYSSDRKGDQGLFNTVEDLIRLCTSMGLDQMMSISLTTGEEVDWVQVPREEHVIINNTSNVRVDTMRPEMIVSALENLRYNHARRMLDLQLFEIGQKYSMRDGKYVETPVMGIVCSGNLHGESWSGAARLADVYFLKSVVENILSTYSVATRLVDDHHDYLSQSLSWNTFQGEAIAWMGTLNHDLEKRYDLQSAACYAEIDLNALIKQSKKKQGIQAIPKYPGMTRDLAFEMPNDKSYADLEVIIRKSGGKLLQDVELVSIYENDKLKEAGVQSWAVRMSFQHSDRTLSDQDIDPVIQRLLKKADKELGVKLRG